MKKCPKCGSLKLEKVDEEFGFIKCKVCGYDELEEDLEAGEERKSQREKARYSPYRQASGKR
ncbi:MAG: hypothetical protein ABIA37_03385 [Candidatus Woesearchaeota archaeon]